MKNMRFEFSQLRSLLRKRADDEDVVDLIGRDPSVIERFEYQGFVEFKDAGVSVIFEQAPRVLSASEFIDPVALHVCAIHFHRESHEGYHAYARRLPSDVSFGDAEADVVRKLGPPLETGGGGISTVLNKPIPHWLRYSLGDSVLQFQLDSERRVEMASLFVLEEE